MELFVFRLQFEFGKMGLLGQTDDQNLRCINTIQYNMLQGSTDPAPPPPPPVVSLKIRLPQKMQSKSTFSCEIVQIYSLFRHGYINKPKLKK